MAQYFKFDIDKKFYHDPKAFWSFFFYLFGLGFFVLILELLKIWIYSKSLKGQDKMCLHDE